MISDRLSLAYDRSADVLYITKSREPAVRGKEGLFGIVWRYNKNGDLVGATILDFLDFWAERQAELVREIAQHFDVPQTQASGIIRDAFQEQRA